MMLSTLVIFPFPIMATLDKTVSGFTIAYLINCSLEDE